MGIIIIYYTLYIQYNAIYTVLLFLSLNILVNIDQDEMKLHCKNEFVILTDQLLPQLHLHFQYNYS